MKETPVLGCGGDDRLFKLFAARYDVPAYVRRARRVEEAFDDLLARCRKQREEWLEPVRLHARMALSVAGNALDERLLRSSRALEPIGPEPKPRLHSPRKLRQALRSLEESIARFNRRWREFLEQLDTAAINHLRSDYNRYYLLEKECALRSPRLARIGFQPLRPLTVDELTSFLPPLPELSATARKVYAPGANWTLIR